MLIIYLQRKVAANGVFYTRCLDGIDGKKILGSRNSTIQDLRITSVKDNFATDVVNALTVPHNFVKIRYWNQNEVSQTLIILWTNSQPRGYKL